MWVWQGGLCARPDTCHLVSCLHVGPAAVHGVTRLVCWLVLAAPAPQPAAGLIPLGTKGQVTVDSMFDLGLLVTVKLRQLEFKGMLYYPPGGATQAGAMQVGVACS
jgi:hypothetical protein